MPMKVGSTAIGVGRVFILQFTPLNLSGSPASDVRKPRIYQSFMSPDPILAWIGATALTCNAELLGCERAHPRPARNYSPI